VARANNKRSEDHYNYKGGHRNWGSLAWCNKIVLQSRHSAERLGYIPLSLSGEDLYTWVQLQENVCGLCRCTPEEAGKRGLVIDHCHSTGTPRGLLCRPCNSALGTLGDTLESIQRVEVYLRGGLYG
jgi:hypothetical protein